MIHIVFEKENIEALRKSFEIDNSLEGDIVSINDDYSVGPIADIFSEEGAIQRLHWWKEVLKDGPYEGLADNGNVDDPKVVKDVKERLNNSPEEFVWIWAAQNKHDVCGYYWLMSQLKDYQGRIFILYLNNLPFINEKGNIFYPTNLFQIQPKEFVKAKKLARPITLSEFEIDPDEWNKLMQENKWVRLLEGGKKIVHKEENFYDAELLKMMPKDFIKGNKFMAQYYSKIKETTGDAFVLWRLKKLVEQEKITMEGSMKNLKDFEIKCPVSLEQVIGNELHSLA